MRQQFFIQVCNYNTYGFPILISICKHRNRKHPLPLLPHMDSGKSLRTSYCKNVVPMITVTNKVSKSRIICVGCLFVNLEFEANPWCNDTMCPKCKHIVQVITLFGKAGSKLGETKVEYIVSPSRNHTFGITAQLTQFVVCRSWRGMFYPSETLGL